MKKQMIQPIMTLCLAFSFAGCAATTKTTEMSAKDEARYAQAIENGAPSPIRDDAVFTVAIGESAAQDVESNTSQNDQTQAAVIETPPAPATPQRSFNVTKSEYDAFFAQSPAIILGRMELDPIVDGGALLGYRVKQLKPFASVDIANEDIIVGINGKMPKNPDDYFNAWEKCKNSAQCTVNIQRGVSRFTLEWKAE